MLMGIRLVGFWNGQRSQRAQRLHTTEQLRDRYEQSFGAVEENWRTLSKGNDGLLSLEIFSWISEHGEESDDQDKVLLTSTGIEHKCKFVQAFRLRLLSDLGAHFFFLL